MDLSYAVLVHEHFDEDDQVWAPTHEIFRHRVVDPVWVHNSPFATDRRPARELVYLLTGGNAGVPLPGVPRLNVISGAPANISPEILRYAKTLLCTHAWWVSGEELSSYAWREGVVQEVDINPRSLGARVADLPIPSRSSDEGALTRVYTRRPSELWGIDWLARLDNLRPDGRYILLGKKDTGD